MLFYDVFESYTLRVRALNMFIALITNELSKPNSFENKEQAKNVSKVYMYPRLSVTLSLSTNNLGVFVMYLLNLFRKCIAIPARTKHASHEQIQTIL